MEYRVAKYNPAFRNAAGAYTRDEWTSFSDIGRKFGGVVLTQAEYERVEAAYVGVALEFLREGGLSSLTIDSLEYHGSQPLGFGEGSIFPLEPAGILIRRVLRNEFWCRLEGDGGFIHLGYDYYMYVRVPRPCPGAERLAQGLGLFVETFRSPYRAD